MTHIKRFAAAFLLALVAAVSARAGDAAVGRASGVKVLLVGDTNAFPGGDAASDLNTVESRLKGLPGFDADRDLRKLTGDDVTAENILKAVDDLEVQPTDALFFYYEGHGAYDPDLADGDPEGGHFLQIPNGGDLRRSDLMRRLKDKGARLTVLITEVCNVAATFHPDAYEVEAPEATEDRSLKDVATVTSASLETLLFDFTGVVDVNASDRGQSSWSNPDGSWFTQSFLKTLGDDDRFLEANGALPGTVNFGRHLWEQTETWGLFLDRVSEKTHGEFQAHREYALDHPTDNNKELRDQEDQRPQVFQLEVQRAEKGTEKDEDFVPPSPFGPDFWSK
jgi:hypothetical protein